LITWLLAWVIRQVSEDLDRNREEAMSLQTTASTPVCDASEPYVAATTTDTASSVTISSASQLSSSENNAAGSLSFTTSAYGLF